MSESSQRGIQPMRTAFRLMRPSLTRRRDKWAGLLWIVVVVGFAIAKATGLIAWSWWTTLSPLWVPIMLQTLLAVGLAIYIRVTGTVPE